MMELTVNFEVNDTGEYWWYGDQFSKEDLHAFKQILKSGLSLKDAFVSWLRSSHNVSELRNEEINSETVKVYSIEFSEL